MTVGPAALHILIDNRRFMDSDQNFTRVLVLPKNITCFPNYCRAGTLVQKDKLSETELVLPRFLVVSDDRTGPISSPGVTSVSLPTLDTDHHPPIS